jgi:hypothetical protein
MIMNEVNRPIRLVKGGEERNPLDVIVVEVREQEVDVPVVVRQVVAECTNPGPGVEDEHAVLGLDTHAGCVAAVALGGRPRSGH